VTTYVKAFDRNGERILVPENEVSELVALGGRVATPEQVAEYKLDQDYEKSSTLDKALGIASVASPLGAVASLVTGGIGSLPPAVEAYRTGVLQGVGGQLTAGVQRQAIEATQGREAAERFAQRVEDLRAGFPTATTAGEIAGFGGGLLAGGESAVARLGGGAVTRTLGRGVLGNVSALGRAAEGVAAKGLGGLASGGALRRAAAAGGRLAAQGAAEGLALSATSAAGESLLKDEDLSQFGDRLLLAIPPGVAYGALGGGALGAAGSLARSAVVGAGQGLARMGSRALSARKAAGASVEAATDAATERLTSAVQAGTEAGTEQLAGAVSGLRGTVEDLRETIQNPQKAVTQKALGALKSIASDATPAERKAFDELSQGAKDEFDALARNLQEALKNPDKQKSLARKFAFDQFTRGFGLQPTKYVQSLRDAGLTAEQGGEFILKNKIINPKANIGQELRKINAETLFQRTDAVRKKVGEKLSKLIDASPAQLTGQDVVDAFDKARARLIPVGQESPTVGNAGALRQLNGRQNEILAALGLKRGEEFILTTPVSAQAVLEQRRGLGQLAYQATRNNRTIQAQALQTAERELENTITGALDRASESASGEMRKQYQKIKRDYSISRRLTDIMNDAANREAKAATFGLRDVQMSSGGASAGAAIGSALAGPLGAFVGTFAGGAAGAVGTKFLRERGSAAAALLMYRAAETGRLAELATLAERRIKQAASGVFEPKLVATKAARAERRKPASEPTASKASKRDPVAEARQASARIADLGTDGVGMTERISNMTQHLEPRLASRMAQNITRAFAYAASKAPKGQRPDPLSPTSRAPLSQVDAEKFLRYVNAANNPGSVLDDMARGKFTREGIETLRAVVPTVYRDIQLAALDELTSRMAKGEKVPFETRLRLGLLLSIPADPTLDPKLRDFLQRNTASAVALAQQKTQGPNPNPARPIDVDTPPPMLDALEQSGPGA
jgi:hypothetical protein